LYYSHKVIENNFVRINSSTIELMICSLFNFVYHV